VGEMAVAIRNIKECPKKKKKRLRHYRKNKQKIPERTGLIGILKEKAPNYPNG